MSCLFGSLITNVMLEKTKKNYARNQTLMQCHMNGCKELYMIPEVHHLPLCLAGMGS